MSMFLILKNDKVIKKKKLLERLFKGLTAAVGRPAEYMQC